VGRVGKILGGRRRGEGNTPLRLQISYPSSFKLQPQSRRWMDIFLAEYIITHGTRNPLSFRQNLKTATKIN
jgi:hypothetical protein